MEICVERMMGGALSHSSFWLKTIDQKVSRLASYFFSKLEIRVLEFIVYYYVLGKEHGINKTNMSLESRIKVIYYSKASYTMSPVRRCYQLPE